MEWSDEKVLDLIREIRNRENVWNPVNRNKINRLKKEDAFREVADLLPPSTSAEVKQKWQSLCQSYRVYRRKVETSKRSGKGANDVYKPCWFAYAEMDAFLRDTYSPQDAVDAVSIHLFYLKLRQNT